MNDDLRIIAAYWSEKYAEAIDDSTTSEELTWAKRPLMAVIGAEADAVGTADEFGDTPIQNMAFLTGYLGYPCDAIYVTATVAAEIMVAEPDEIIDPDNIDPTALRSGFITWAHCIPTRETALITFVPYIHDDGTNEWLKVMDAEPTLNGERVGGVDETWEALVHAAHDFDGIPIEDDSQADRALARSLIVADNGTGYEAEILEPNLILNAARAWGASQ